MPLTQEKYLAFEGNIQKVWDAVVKGKKDYNKLLFNVSPSSRARELHRSTGTFGRMQEFNGQVHYDEFADGYEKEYRHGAYTTGVQVDWRLYEDKEYSEIKKRVNGVAYGVYKTLVAHGVSVYNNAFSSSFTGPDGLSLCNAAHKLTADSDTQSNTGTLDMSVDAIDSIIKAGLLFKDDRGDEMPVEFDQIVCGVHWMDKVKKIVGSDKEPFTSDNQINVQNDLSYVVHPWITGKKWFMTSKSLLQGGDGLNFFMRQDPKKLERDSDFDSLILKWRSVGRWSYGWDNFYVIFGQNPA